MLNFDNYYFEGLIINYSVYSELVFQFPNLTN
jgi:hypothetical protein